MSNKKSNLEKAYLESLNNVVDIEIEINNLKLEQEDLEEQERATKEKIQKIKDAIKLLEKKLKNLK